MPVSDAMKVFFLVVPWYSFIHSFVRMSIRPSVRPTPIENRQFLIGWISTTAAIVDENWIFSEITFAWHAISTAVRLLSKDFYWLLFHLLATVFPVHLCDSLDTHTHVDRYCFHIQPSIQPLSTLRLSSNSAWNTITPTSQLFQYWWNGCINTQTFSSDLS